jgi:hypothetical protein
MKQPTNLIFTNQTVDENRRDELRPASPSDLGLSGGVTGCPWAILSLQRNMFGSVKRPQFQWNGDHFTRFICDGN